jgi:hypothetical protein
VQANADARHAAVLPEEWLQLSPHETRGNRQRAKILGPVYQEPEAMLRDIGYFHISLGQNCLDL